MMPGRTDEDDLCAPRSPPTSACARALSLCAGMRHACPAVSEGLAPRSLPLVDPRSVEHAVPEQFVTTLVNGKWHTEPVAHSAG